MSAPLPVCDLLTEQEWAIVCAIRTHDGDVVDGEISGIFYQWAETGIMSRMPPTSAERERQSARGRLGGNARAATATTREEITQAARDRVWQKFLDQVPAEITDPDERRERAEGLRRAHMTRLSARAAEARRAKSRIPTP